MAERQAGQELGGSAAAASAHVTHPAIAGPGSASSTAALRTGFGIGRRTAAKKSWNRQRSGRYFTANRAGVGLVELSHPPDGGKRPAGRTAVAIGRHANVGRFAWAELMNNSRLPLRRDGAWRASLSVLRQPALLVRPDRSDFWVRPTCAVVLVLLPCVHNGQRPHPPNNCRPLPAMARRIGAGPSACRQATPFTIFMLANLPPL